MKPRVRSVKESKKIRRTVHSIVSQTASSRDVASALGEEVPRLPCRTIKHARSSNQRATVEATGHKGRWASTSHGGHGMRRKHTRNASYCTSALRPCAIIVCSTPTYTSTQRQYRSVKAYAHNYMQDSQQAHTAKNLHRKLCFFTCRSVL